MVSHTATGEWQSFETRMRRRRAERLALRAEAAASAGFQEDARACLAEARTLAPDLPEIAVAEAALVHEAEPLVVAEEPARSSRSAFIAFATVSILLAAFVGGWIAYRDVPEVANVAPAQATTAAATVDPAPVPSDSPTAPVAPKPEALAPPAAARPSELAATAVPAPERITDTSPGRSDELKTRALANAEPAISREMQSPEPTTSNPRVTMAASETLPTLPDVASALPPAPPAARVEPPPVVTPAALPEAGLANANLRAPSVEVKAPVVEVSQEPRVQAVLNRYASAYSALDADAAERVWPTVNRGALARAFDGLASQRVNLGDCRIDVSGNKAHARCAGSATWSPKVGSGTHNESRVWTFDLVRVGADWQILNARAQNK